MTLSPNQALQAIIADETTRSACGSAPGVCQRPPALPFGLPAAGYVAPLHSACAPAASHRPTTDPLTTPTALRPTPSRVDERRRAHPSGCLRQSVSLRSTRPHRLRRPPQSLSLGSLGDLPHLP